LAEVTIEDVGPCRKHLKITVPRADVQKKLDENYDRLSATAVVDGFRKGHVPRRLLERRFGEEVLEEVKQAVLAEASEKALKEHDLKVLGTPSFDNVEFAPDKDCVFEITLETEPEFELAEYKGLTLRREPVKVSEEDIERGLESLRRRYGRLDLMPDGTPITADDRIVCDWEIACDGETIATEKDGELIVRGRRFGDIELEKDIAEALAGAVGGERRSVAGKVLDSYPVEKWREKECTINFTVREIRRPVLPELNEEFARKLDFESVEELRSAVARSIRQAKMREAELDLEQQLYDQLLQAMPFDLPEGVLKAQARSIMRREQFRLRLRGMSDEELEKHLETLRDASEEVAARNLKIYFILNRIAEKEKIFVTENEVENRIAALANSYRMTAQRMRRQLEQEESLGELRAGMRAEKTVAFLMRHARIEGEPTAKEETPASSPAAPAEKDESA